MNKKDLKQYLTIAKKLVGKSSLSILSTAVVEITNSGMNLLVNNLRIDFRGSFPPVDGEVENEVLLSPTTFLVTSLQETLKLCSGNEVTVSFKDDAEALCFNDIEVYRPMENGKYLHPIEKFPESHTDLSTVVGGKIDKLPMLTKMSPFLSKDQSRLYMSGTKLDFKKDNTITAVATDGGRLIICDEFASFERDDSDETLNIEGDIIVPDMGMFAKLPLLNFRILKLSNSYIVHLFGEDFDVYFTTLDGQYPNYERVTPDLNNSFYTKWEYDKDKLFSFLKQAVSLTKTMKINKKTACVHITSDSISLKDSPLKVDMESNFKPGLCHAMSLFYLNEYFNIKDEYEFWVASEEVNKTWLVKDITNGATIIMMPRIS